MKNVKKILFLLTAVLLVVSFVSCAKEVKVDPVKEAAMLYFAEKPDHSYMMDETDLIAKVKAGEEMFIIDIRMAADYEKDHIKGSVNAFFGPELAKVLTLIPSDMPVVIYCYSGQTAGQAVALLNIAGFNAKSVKYGYKFGLAKTPGFEEVIETTVNEWDRSVNTSINPDILAAVQNYFNTVETNIPKHNIILEPDAMKAFESKDPAYAFVDVRSAKDFTTAHITGAVNIPYAKGMETQFSSLPMDKKLIVNCYSGQTAGQTIAILRLLGYDALSLKGGMGTPKNAPMGWVNNNYPLGD
jgi:rhodanese-related sulfurtransferase